MKNKKFTKKFIFFNHLLHLTKSIFFYKLLKKTNSFPSVFQIQTVNTCNGSCLMCPNPTIEQNTEYIPDNLFKKIIDEIIHHSSSPSIILSLQNEPFLDGNLFNKIQYIKNKGGEKTQVLVVTNGSLLTNEKINELEKSELDSLIISLDAFTEETFNKIRKGLNFNKIKTSIEKILKSNFSGSIFVGYVKQRDNLTEFSKFKEYWRKKGVGIHLDFVNNRSSDLKNFKKICLKYDEYSFGEKIVYFFFQRYLNICPTPLTTVNILTNGDVILCCNDYSKKMILGNVNKNSILDIWNNEKYKRIREKFRDNEYKTIKACQNCSVMNLKFIS